MKKDRLQSILQLAEVKENGAARDFARAREAWEFNQTKLTELRAFRDDYYQPESAAGMTANRFQSTRQFLNQLSEAIDQQEVQVSVMMDQMSSEQQVWNDHRVKRLSIEKLVEKRTTEHLVKTDKQNQSILDELALRLRDRSERNF